ncbi:clathrin interactor EPSIN 1 [Tanacetum coccineum]
MVFTTDRASSKILLTGKDGMISFNLFYTGQKVPYFRVTDDYMFVVAAKKVDLKDVGIVGGLSAGTEEKDKGLPNSLYMGRAMGTGSGLGKSTGYSTSAIADMDDFFSSLSFQK